TLKNKHDMKQVQATFEKEFKSTPTENVYVSNWTPSSLRLPNPPIVRILVSGRTDTEKRELMRTITSLIEDNRIGRTKTSPNLHLADGIELRIAEATKFQAQMARLDAASVLAPIQVALEGEHEISL